MYIRGREIPKRSIQRTQNGALYLTHYSSECFSDELWFWLQEAAAPKNNYTNLGTSTTYVAPQSFGRGGGRGGFGGGNNNRNGWGRQQFQRNNATGANDTPLGTPTRVSPVSTPPSPPISVPNGHANGTVVKSNEGPVATETKEKKKKDKREKRKSEDVVSLSTSKSNNF